MSIDHRDDDSHENTPDENAPPFDEKLRALYRQLPADEPHPDVDAAIRAAARRAVTAGPQPLRSSRVARTARWALPLATAASLVIALTVVLRTEHPERAGVPAALQAPVSEKGFSGYTLAERSAVKQESARQQSSAPQASAAQGVAAADLVMPAPAPALVVQAAAIQEMSTRAMARQADDESVAAFAGAGAAMPESVVTDAVAASAAAPPAQRTEKTMRPAAAALVAEQAQQAPSREMTTLAATPTADEWPFDSVVDTRIAEGVLAGFQLLAREGSQGDGAVTFRLRGETGDANAWQTQVMARLQDAGWMASAPCSPDAGTALQRDGQHVALMIKSDALWVRWQAGGCR